jgi:hypothetical protein
MTVGAGSSSSQKHPGNRCAQRSTAGPAPGCSSIRAAVYGWTRPRLFVQQNTLNDGWEILAVVTVTQTILRIVLPTRGFRP